MRCRNSDADTTNLEKSIIQDYIQCKVVILVVIKKTETEHIKRLTTKEENNAFSPQTVDAGDLQKWSFWSRDHIILDIEQSFHKRVYEELKYNVDKAIYDSLQKVHGDNLNISTDFKIISIKDI